MDLLAPFKAISKFSLKYKKIIILSLLLWSFWFFGLGLIGGWLITKGTLSAFRKIKDSDKILIIAPHIDDEVIGTGGIIQEAKAVGAKILVVYLTNGDDNLSSVVTSKEKTFDPNDFVRLGEERMQEGKKAASLLGLSEKEILFLGYPDKGLLSLLSKNFSENNPYTAQRTRFNYNPYTNTHKNQQLYAGANLLTDLSEIVADFSPTVVILPHPRDTLSDHRAAFQFTQKALEEKQLHPKIYSYLVHYPLYPPKKRFSPNEFLYPPKKLFSKEGWYSFDLSENQERKKLQAVNQNTSQLKTSFIQDLLRSFVKRNEIFEEFE